VELTARDDFLNLYDQKVSMNVSPILSGCGVVGVI